MAIHVFCGRVGHYVSAKFNRAAKHWGGEGVVHDKRHPVAVRHTGELLYIKHFHTRIRKGFPEQELCVGLESGGNLFLRSVRRYEGDLDTHFGEGVTEKIESTAINVAGADQMISGRAYIQASEQVCRLAGGCEHRGDTAFKFSYLGCHVVVGGVL